MMSGELTTRIGRRVKFGVPQDVYKRGGVPSYGTIVDEVWANPDINKSPSRQPNGNDDWGDYSFCAQLIKFDEGPYLIRLAYYRRPAGQTRWRFGSQMTVTLDWKTTKDLLEKTLAKRNWFAHEPVIDAAGTT